MGKFSAGLFAGALVGMGMAMLDRRTLRYAKRAMKKSMKAHCM